MGEHAACLGEGLCPALAQLAQFPIQLPQGLSTLGLSFCMDKICQSLHFSQAQLAMGKRPPGELSSLGWPQSWHTTCRKASHGLSSLILHPMAGDIQQSNKPNPRWVFR